MNYQQTINQLERTLPVIKNEDQTTLPKNGNTPLPLPLQLVKFAFKQFGDLAPRYFGSLGWYFFQRPLMRAVHKKSDQWIDTAHRYQYQCKNNNTTETIQCYSWGDGEATVLLVHGWESRGTAMRAFVPHFLERGYRVMTFDAPAHGDSTGKNINAYFYAEVIAQIVAHESQNNPIKAIIAHSIGGFSTSLMLEKMYDNLSNRTQLDQFVSVAAFSHVDIPFDNFQRWIGFSDKVKNYMYQAAKKEIGIDPKEADFRKISHNRNVKSVLLVHDFQDRLTSFDSALRLHANWKHAQLLPTDGFGHFRLLKSPQVVQKIVDFIG